MHWKSTGTQQEKEFLEDQMQRLGLGENKMVYHKVVKQQYGEKLVQQFNNLLQNDLNVIVYNFVDMSKRKS